MLPIATQISTQGSNTSSLPTRPASADPTSTSSGNGNGSGNGPKVESAYGVRALPIKIYLPDNAPVVHELIPPLTSDGTSYLPPLSPQQHLQSPSTCARESKQVSSLTLLGKPQTVLSALQTHLPLLFPPRSSTSNPYPIAFPILQGVELPPDAELAWLSTCGCGADGWLRIGIRLRATTTGT